jgi:hypothetical protein
MTRKGSRDVCYVAVLGGREWLALRALEALVELDIRGWGGDRGLVSGTIHMNTAFQHPAWQMTNLDMI